MVNTSFASTTKWLVGPRSGFRFILIVVLALTLQKLVCYVWVVFVVINCAAIFIEHLDPIEKTVLDLNQDLNELQEEQKYLRSVERLHRESTENKCYLH